MSSPISSPRFQQGPSIPIKKDSRFQRELFKKGFIAAFTGKEDTYTGKEEWPSSHPEYPKGYALGLDELEWQLANNPDHSPDEIREEAARMAERRADQVEDGIFGPLNRTERWRNWKSEPHDFLKGLLIGATTSCPD